MSTIKWEYLEMKALPPEGVDIVMKDHGGRFAVYRRRGITWHRDGGPSSTIVPGQSYLIVPDREQCKALHELRDAEQWLLEAVDLWEWGYTHLIWYARRAVSETIAQAMRDLRKIREELGRPPHDASC